ncbi:MAG: late competence development ComFB family protein [Oscillospiraceae bacterium]|nr:late competence development ComFB family protein [Oscillospiraceae bacterium]
MSGKKTNKTSSVMKLISKGKGAANPIIDEKFKEEIILAKDKPDTSKNETGINIIEELVQEWLPETMKRFNCPDSDIWKAEITVKALNILPPKYVPVNGAKDYANIQNMKEKYKKQVINTLVKLAISSKKGENSD